MSQRDGNVTCACGNVNMDVSMPFSSYGIVKQTCAYCQCRDCQSFALGVRSFREQLLSTQHQDKTIQKEMNEKAEVMEKSYATEMFQIYKSDVKAITTGIDNLKCCKLFPGANFLRYYTTCCGSPFMMILEKGPILLLYPKHTYGNLPKIDPLCVLKHSHAPPDSPPTPEGIVVRQEFNAPVFIFRALFRIVFGLLFGKGKLTIQEQLEKVPIVIGADHIKSKQD